MRCHMTQGAPVLAGMSNTATQTTEIDFSGPTWLDVLDLTGVCAFGLAVTNNNASMSATSGVQSFAKGPNSTAVYAVGNGRGVYAVGAWSKTKMFLILGLVQPFGPSVPWAGQRKQNF